MVLFLQYNLLDLERTLMLSSEDPLANNSLEMDAKQNTAPTLALRTRSHVPLRVFHTRIVLSSDALANRFGAISSTAITKLVCPLRVALSLWLVVFHSLTSWSYDPLANKVPSSSVVTAVTTLLWGSPSNTLSNFFSSRFHTRIYPSFEPLTIFRLFAAVVVIVVVEVLVVSCGVVVVVVVSMVFRGVIVGGADGIMSGERVTTLFLVDFWVICDDSVDEVECVNDGRVCVRVENVAAAAA